MTLKTWILGLIAGLMMVSTASAAQRFEVWGTGKAVRGCWGGTGYNFCVDDVEREAERDSRWKAENECSWQSNRQGRLQSVFPNYCAKNCFPTFPPRDGQMATVDCTADCRYTCVIR